MVAQKAIHSHRYQRYIGLAIFVLLCCAVIAPNPRRGVHAEPATPVVQQTTAEPGSASSTPNQAQTNDTTLAVGDRVKIGFFEAFDIPQARTPAGPQPGVRTFYQRLDLGGDYSIQQNGSIDIPKLGTFQFAGRSPREAQQDIASAFEGLMSRHIDVSIAILERQPVYIIGPVKNPGVYKYVPGMTVLHAIAVAGGIDHGAEQLTRVMDFLRERKQLDDLRSKLSTALAQQARLKAESDGFDKAVNLLRLVEVGGRERAERLVEIVGKERAEGLLAGEEARLEQDRLSFKEDLAKRSDEIQRLKLELSTLEAKLAPNAHRLQAREKRLAALQGLGSNVATSTLNAAENEKLDLEARHQETLLAIEHSRQKLLQLERAAVFTEQDRQARIARELATNNEEIYNLDHALRSSAALTSIMGHGLEAQLGQAPAIEIVRQVLGNRSTMKADETSRLEPGDIIRIRPTRPDATSLDSPASSSQTF